MMVFLPHVNRDLGRRWLPALLLLLASGCLRPAAPPELEAKAGLWQADSRGPIAPFLAPILATEPAPNNAQDAPDADLARIADTIGDAKIVGLGEYFHGAHELHRFSHRLFAYLAEKKDFDVYALELDAAHVALLDEYVQGRRNDLDALLAKHWRPAIFYDQALRDLLIWMRDQNLRHGKKLDVAGFDLKQPDLAFESLAKDLRAVEPEVASQAEELYARVAALGAYGIFPNVSGYSGTLLIDLPPRKEPRRLHVRLRGRARGLDFGHGGLRADTQGGAQWASQYLDFKAADLGEDAWLESSLDLQVPADAQRLRLILYHRGNGTFWLGGLEAELGGVPLEIPATLPEVRPLLFPGIQRMDYQAFFDPDSLYAGKATLRIDCSPLISDALAAGSALRDLVEKTLAEDAAYLSDGEVAKMRLACRLIEEALAWRTLKEPNRDVFLAENLSWLHREGFPGRKILALAHSGHA